MPRRAEHTPKHRGPAPEPAVRRGLRRSVVFSGVALAATGFAVSSGVAVSADNAGTAASASLASSRLTGTGVASPATERVATTADLDRERAVSRSDRRTSVDAVKARTLSQDSGGQVTATEDLSDQDPRTVARAMLPEFGFSSDQFSCLDSLYNSESGWRVNADNPTSSAYGIPQALPGSKMSSAGADWATNPVTQIKWGLGYIADRYGTPCSAWGFKQGNGWY